MLIFQCLSYRSLLQGGRAWRPSKRPNGGERENFDNEKEEDDEETEEDEEEKKENYKKEKEMEGKRRDEKDMQDILVVEEGRMVKIPLPLISSPCISFCNVLSAKKKVNNHIVEMHKNPVSCKLC